MTDNLKKNLLKEYRKSRLCESMTFWRFMTVFNHISGFEVLYKPSASVAHDIIDHGDYVRFIMEKMK